jgi:fibronectin-binding autotransporter adhesin
MLGDYGPVRRSDRFCRASHRHARTASKARRVLACALLLTASAAFAQTLPSGAKVVSGSVTVTQPNGQQLLINQGSNNAIINWNSFSIGRGDSVTFVQPGANSVALNRVIGASPSAIYGSLSATGKVFLVNPAGVLFAPGASVNTGSFVASTLGISDNDFLAGRYTFQNGGAAGGIVNQGTVNARDGAVVFIAPQIVNVGSISATSGVALAAGDRVSMTLDADSPLLLSVDASALKAAIVNSGAIFSGGPVLLSAQARDSALDTVINSSGVIRAKSISSDGEDIQLNGGAQGIVAISGTLDASGAGAHAHGGSIAVSGDQLTLAGTARLDASGAAGGGTILVGGAAHGAGPMQNASTTTIAQGAVLNASATGQGNGGQVVVWSNDSTRFAGQIVARGGANGGDGGNAEVSSKGALIFEGGVDLSAPYGRRGTLLLDPDDLCIVSAADATCGAVAVGTGTGGATFTSATGGSYVLSSTLSTLSSTANLVLQATNDIIFKTNLSLAASTSASNGSITLTAGNAIQMNGNSLSTTGGSILMTAGAGGMTLGNLSAGSGTITLGLSAANGIIAQSSGTSIAGTGGLVFNGGTLQLTQTNGYSGGTTVSGGTLALIGSGTAGVSGSAITVGSGAALDVQNTLPNAVTLSGGTLETTTGNGVVNGAVMLSGSGIFTTGASGAVLTVDGIVSGSTPVSALTVNGPGTVVLTGVNTYGGGTTLASGSTLSGNTDSLVGDFTNNGTLVFNQASNGAYGGAISGTGQVVKQNTGTLTFSAAQSYSGSTSVVGGVLQGDTNSLQGNITLSGATGLVFDQASAGTFNGAIGGAGAVTKLNTGTLTFSTAQLYTGGTTVSGGTLALSGSGTAGASSGAVTVGSGAALDVQNTLPNAVTLSGGTLETSTGSGIVNGAVTLNGSGTLTTGSSSTLTVNGAITDGTPAGALTVNGTGLVTLTGVNTYSGGTTLASGTLQGNTDSLQGNIANSASLIFDQASNGTFSGTISGSGTVTKQNSGTLTFNSAQGYGGGTNVTGGTLALTGSGTAGVSGSGITVDSGAALDVQNTLPNAVTLSGGTLETSTGSGVVNGAVMLNGSGTFTTGGSAVLTVTGIVNGSTPVSALTVNGPGTVVLTGVNTYGGGTTLASGSTLSGNTDSLVGDFTNNGTLVFNQASNGTYGGAISGAGQVVKQNTGTLTFSAAQSYSGSTAVVGGVLQGDTNSLHGNITLSGTTGLVFDQASAGTFNGAVGGTGAVTKQNAGTLTFSTAQLYTGGTTVSGGTLDLSGSGTAGASSGAVAVGSGAALDVRNTLSNAVTLTGGTLETTTGNGVVNGAVTLNGNGTLTTGISSTLTVNGAITDGTPAGALTINGTGLVTLAGVNSYSGGTTLAGGTLQGNTNSLQGSIANSASLIFDQASNGTFSGTISGAGMVTKQNSGTLTFNSAQSYGGGTNVTGGTLALTGSGTAGASTSAITVDSGAALDVQNTLPNAVTLSGGTLETTTGNGVANGAVTLNGSGTFTTGSSAVLTVNGIVGGSTPLSGLTVTGAGTAALTGLNTYSGGTNITSGTLALTGNGSAGASAGAITVGSGGALDVQNTLPNAVTLSGGTLETTTGNGVVNGAVTLSGSGTFTTGSSAVLTVAGIVSGSTPTSSLTVNGSGTVVLTGLNTYSGGTTLASGSTLSGNTGSLIGNFTNSGTLVFNQASNGTYGGTISGNGLVVKQNTGTLTFSTAQSYSGGTAVTGGTLALTGSGTAGASSGSIAVDTGAALDVRNTLANAVTLTGGMLETTTGNGIVNGAVTLNGSNTFTTGTSALLTVNGIVIGTTPSSGLTVSGPGTVVLTGLNTYGGGTSVNSGTLALTGNGTAGASSGVVAVGSGAALDVRNTVANAVNLTGGTLETSTGSGVVNGGVTLNGSGTFTTGNSAMLTVNGIVSGSTPLSALTVNGAGTVVLTGVNTYGGGTTLASGTLQGNTSSLQGSIVNSASLIFDQASNGTFSGTISGSGTVTKQNSGTLTFNSAQSYGGGTNVTGGTLALTGSGMAGASTSAITVGSGGALDVQNTLPDAVTLSGGTLETTTGNGVVNGAVTLSGNGIFTTGSGAVLTVTGIVSGSTPSSAMTVNGSGTVVLTGLNTYGGGTTLASGSTLSGNTGSLVGNFTNNGTLVFNQASNGTYGGTISGNGLVVKQNTGTLTFNAAQSYGGGTAVTGGTLALTGSGTAGASSGAIVVDSGAALDVRNTLSNAVILTGGTLETTTGNGVINGAVTLNGSSVFTTGSSAVLTVNGNVSGGTPSSGLAVNGPGTVVLNGVNTYGGGTTLASGSTLQGNTNSLQGGIVNGGSLIFNQASNGTFNGTIGGNGAVTKLNAGTLTFNTAQSYGGGTNVTGGTLSLAGSGTAGASTGSVAVSSGAALDVRNTLANAVTLTGGTLETTNGTGVVNGTVTLNGSGTFAAGSSAVLAVSGIVSGTTPSSGLTVSGPGTVVLTGLNTYSGGTAIASGTLQGNTNSLRGGIANSGTLAFNQASNGTYGGTISGSGVVVKQNTGTLTLSAPQSYTGGTAVTGGALQGNTVSLRGSITLASSTGLVFEQASAGTFSGAISGAGTVTKQNTGTLTFNSAQSYTGGTDITGGTLSVTGTGTAGTSAGSINVGSGAALDVQNTLPNAVNLTGGTLETATGSGIANGAVTLYGSGAFATGSSATLTVNGAIADGTPNSALAVDGVGLVTLTGVNTYSGGTTLASGTLQGNTNSLQGSIASSGALIFDQESNGTFSGTIGGIGTVTKQNSGTLTFNTAQLYTGGTSVTGGTLAVAGGGTAGAATSAITIGNGAALDAQNTLPNALRLAGGTLETTSGAGVVTGPVTVAVGGGASISAGANASLTVNGAIGDDGTGQAVTKQGAGLVTLNGANSYRGGTTVQAGTLALGATGSLGSGVATVDGGATLRLNGATLSSNLSLLDGSTLATTGSVNALTGTLNVRSATFDIGAGSTLNAGSAFNHFTGTATLTGGGSLSLRADSGGIQLGATTLANLSLQSDGAVTQAAAATISGTTSIATTGNASITLDAANRFGGALQLSGGPASVTSVGALTFGTSSVASLNVSAGGDIGQTGVLSVAGASNLSTPNGNLNLGLANTFGGLVNVSAAGGTLNSAQNLAVTLSTPGSMNVTAGGALTISGTAGSLSTTSGGATTFGGTQVGNALTIVAGDRVTTSVGASVSANSITMTLPTNRDIGAVLPGEFVLSNVDRLTLLSGHDAFFLLPAGQQTRFSIGANVGCARVNMGPCIGNEALVSAVSSVQSGIQQTVINQMHEEDEFTLKVKYGFAGDLQQVQTYPHEGDLEVRQPESCQLADHAVAEAQGESVRLRAREACP